MAGAYFMAKAVADGAEAPNGAYVRCTMYDGGAWQRLCTKYEVRCTIWESSAATPRVWRLVPPMYDFRRTTEAADAAYVRSTMYDVRLPNSRALRGTVALGSAYVRFSMYDVRRWQLTLPMDEVRCTMYDCRIRARGAGIFAKQMRAGCPGTMRGRGYKGAGRWRLSPPMYEVQHARRPR